MSQKSRAKPTAVKKPFLPNLDENVAPWPEWQDIAVNSVTWDINQLPIVPVKSGKQSKASARLSIISKDSKSNEDILFFQDGWKTKYVMDGLEVDRWERAYKVGLAKSLINDEEFADLTSSNHHLYDSNLLKTIIDSISCLYIASAINPFFTEFPGLNFEPLPDYWQPWHHIYAHTKAGSGDPHTPTYNNYGMYFVRLYFLGKWRRILVDDFMPVDKDGRILLPVTCSRDLWLPLLTKALLRVMTVCNDGDNISVITALTGWIKMSIKFRGADSKELWKICCSHLLKEDEMSPPINNGIHCSYIDGSCLNNNRHITSSPFQKTFMFANIIEPIYTLEEIEPLRRELFVYFKEVNQDWIRTKDYPAWKEYRWFDWAYKQNILMGKVGDVFKNIEVYCPHWRTFTNCVHEALNHYVSSEEKIPHDGFCIHEFDKFIGFVQQVHIYYLPSQFENSFRSDTFFSTDINQHAKKEQHSKMDNKNKMADPTRFYDPSCNSYFLLIDSPFCKRIYFDVMFLKDMPNSKGHIICEKYFWHNDTQSYPEFFMKTCGSNTKIITAGPGRHAFKLWCKLPDAYFIQIFSNTPFVLENIETLHEIYQEESISYKIYASLISDNFMELYDSDYGTESHCKALKQYVESFFPTDLRLKSSLPQNLIFRIPFDKLLEEVIMEFILESDIVKYPQNLINLILKLRNIFLNPKFGEEVLSRYENQKAAEASKETPTTAKSKASSKPASQMKPATVPADIYFDKPLNNIKLLKKLMYKEKSFFELYPFCNDDETKLVYHDYKGKFELQNLHPFSIAARIILNIHSLSYTPCGIYAVVTNDFVRVCIYDIASMNLVPIKFDRNMIWKLVRSESNYIVFIQCTTQSTKVETEVKAKQPELHWRLRVIGSDLNCLLHPCQLALGTNCNLKPSSVPQLISEAIKGFYLPNPYNVITKFLISLSQNDIITLQISVSCPSAIIKVLIRDGFNNIVKELEGRGFVFLPAIILKLDNIQSKENKGAEPYYSGEVRLLPNTWKLSDENMSFIDSVKEYYIPFSNISEASKTKKKKGKGSVESLDDNVGPTWTVSMTTENERGKMTKLIPDTREYEAFKTTIKHSTKGSEDRSRNALELRTKFRASQTISFTTDETIEEESTESIKLNKQHIFRLLLDEYK